MTVHALRISVKGLNRLAIPRLRGVLTAAAMALFPAIGTADDLENGFQTPPVDARPQVWWHWLNGALSEEGIKQDLGWMHRIGISGVQIFSGAMPNNDGVVTPSVSYMSPPWKDLFRGAVERAADFDMKVTLPTSAGWSETGAPFVKPRDGMKKLVWSETEVKGGEPVQARLPMPPDVSGPFATIPIDNKTLTGEEVHVPRFYADSRVIAYRIPEGERSLPQPTVTTAEGEVSPAPLFDGKLEKALQLNYPSHDNPAWVQFDYPEPVTLRSLTVVLAPKKLDRVFSAQIPARLEVGEDGRHFEKVTDVTAGAFTQNTNAFAPITGRTFRVVLQPEPPPANPMAALDMAPGALPQPGLPIPAPPQTLTISELALSGAARVQRFEEKAGFAAVPDYHAIPTPSIEPPLTIDRGAVIDLTERMNADGSLDWTPPNGRWRILRLGYSLTGHVNGPTSVEATGLEVDKLSASRVRNYMETYLAQFSDIVGSKLIGEQGIQGTLNDSFEAGFANWTDDILNQFKSRRGYDPTPFLPALTGRVVDSAESSDAFLYDFRRTIADLLAEAHYGTVARVARDHGLTVYGEALESGARPSLGDDMAMRHYTDVPMGAMWTYPQSKQPNPAHVADLKGAASVAHLQGRRFVGAESFTSMMQPWAHSPRELKHIADRMLALGVNRFIIHSSVHQPLMDKAPGLALWIFGQYFNRNETWAEQAQPWLDYLARTSWLLSRGRFAADVAYFYGEEAPLVTLAEQGGLKDVPVRYGFDYVNADALLSLFSVQDGILVTPSGMHYHVLQLGGSSQRMTLPVLRKLHDLVNAGAVVVGNKPVASPSLADDREAFRELADRLWPGSKETRVGKGKVITGTPVETALAKLDVPPDQEVIGQKETSLLFLHRVLDDGHVWFVSNPEGVPFLGEVAFRVRGFQPELWDAKTGTSRPLSFRIENGRTVVPLELNSSGSALVVFRTPTKLKSRTVEAALTNTLLTVDGDWTVRFQPERGAPAGDVQMPAGSWTDSKEPGVRYFSGTATYTKNIDIPSVAKGSRVALTLGEVNDIAEVSVNGESLHTLWHPPYSVDITDAIRPGKNRVQVKVTNRWVNRLIGDAQSDTSNVTWTVAPVYSADAPLLPAGLIGPVTVIEKSNRGALTKR